MDRIKLKHFYEIAVLTSSTAFKYKHKTLPIVFFFHYNSPEGFSFFHCKYNTKSRLGRYMEVQGFESGLEFFIEVEDFKQNMLDLDAACGVLYK